MKTRTLELSIVKVASIIIMAIWEVIVYYQSLMVSIRRSVQDMKIEIDDKLLKKYREAVKKKFGDSVVLSSENDWTVEIEDALENRIDCFE